jgi:hypothetical protein
MATVFFIDPRGGIVEAFGICAGIANQGHNIYCTAPQRGRLWNIFECVNEQTRHIAEDHIITAFADLWRDIFNAEAEEILRTP